MSKLEDRHIKEILTRDNIDFNKLNLAHRECEQKLAEIKARVLEIRTDKDWLEEQNLKKQKLRLKDSMEKYIVEYRKQVNIT
ncbi:MAG: hypothetical protein NT166_00780 [Candidatus Aminicenantes bacterium]|jgi:uncharacterized protein YdcH (DUF465 family)|nr:hypothetical protein [Candidatus Aminicenantes bacterium]